VPAPDLLVARFRRRLAGWYVLRGAVAAVTLWAFAWGTVVLILRATQGTPAEALLWGAAGVPVVVALAAWLALRKLPAKPTVRAMLDRHGDCGGLLMAGAERDLGGWADALPRVKLPRVRWNAARPLGGLAVAAAYLVLGFLVPADPSLLAGETRLDITREADRLTEQVQVLKEEKILDAERAETIKEKLDQVRDQSQGKDPVKTLEALDHLNEVVKQTGRQAAESAAKQANQFGNLEAAAEALSQAAPGLDSDALTSLMGQMAALAKAAAAEGDQLGDEFTADLADALNAGKFTPEQLAALAEALKEGKGKNQKKIKKLLKAKLIDADDLKECDGECDAAGLAAFLKKNGGKCDLADAMCACRGGVTEGPGHVAELFGDKSSEEGFKFKEEALPPAELKALKDSQLTGMSSAAPQTAPKSGPAVAEALKGAAAGGGSANAATVLPQHRAAVERYFDRPKK
jgi:hypothetical protein